MPKSFPLRGARAFVLASAAALVAAHTVLAEEPQAASAAKVEDATPSPGGMKVGVDPETGRARALTPEEAQQLATAMRAKLAQIRAQALARRRAARSPEDAASGLPTGKS